MIKNLLRLSVAITVFAGTIFGEMGAALAKDNLVVAFQGGLNNKPVQCHIKVVAKGISDITGMKIEYHAGGSAFATPKKLFPQLSRGITDLSVMPLAYTPGRFPLAEIVTLPFIQKDHKALTIAATKLYRKFLNKEFKGTHPLALMALPHYNIHLKKPIKDLLTGLKGLRIRVVGKGLSNVIRALGADVVGMPITQVYENMQKGVMNGFVLPNMALGIFKLHEVSDYHLIVNISAPVIFIGMSQKLWQGLKPEHQKQIGAKYEGTAAAVRYVSCFDKIDKMALKFAKKNNGVVHRPSPDEIVKLKKIVQPVTEAYLSGLEKKGLPARAFYNELKVEAAAEAKARMK